MAQSTLTDADAQAPEHEVILTETAAAKVASLLIQEGRDDLRLRVAVQPGGCSGLVYQLYFDERLPRAGDPRRGAAARATRGALSGVRASGARAASAGPIAA